MCTQVFCGGGGGGVWQCQELMGSMSHPEKGSTHKIHKDIAAYSYDTDRFPHFNDTIPQCTANHQYWRGALIKRAEECITSAVPSMWIPGTRGGVCWQALEKHKDVQLSKTALSIHVFTVKSSCSALNMIHIMSLTISRPPPEPAG